MATREDFLALGWVGGAGDSITSQFPNARRLTFKIAIEPVVQKTLKLGKDVHTDIFLVHVDDNDLAFSRSARRAACSGPRLAQLAAGSNVCFNMKSTQISRAPTDVRDGRSPVLRLMLRPIVQISCVLVRRRSGCTSPNTPEHGLLVLPCKTLMRKVPTKIA